MPLVGLLKFWEILNAVWGDKYQNPVKNNKIFSSNSPHRCLQIYPSSFNQAFGEYLFFFIASFKIKCTVSYLCKISSLLIYPCPAGRMVWAKFTDGLRSCKSNWSAVINWWLSNSSCYTWQWIDRKINESGVPERKFKKVVPRTYTSRSYKMIKVKSIFHLIPSKVTDPPHTCKCSCLAMLPFRIIPSLYLLTYFHSIYNLYANYMQNPFCYTFFHT